MTAKDVEQLLNARPFTTFTIHTTDGETYRVTHPDLVMLHPSILVIGVPNMEMGPRHVTRVIHLGLRHIVRMEPELEESETN